VAKGNVPLIDNLLEPAERCKGNVHRLVGRTEVVLRPVLCTILLVLSLAFVAAGLINRMFFFDGVKGQGAARDKALTQSQRNGKPKKKGEH
jgi:hypothetical protein